MDKLDLYQMHFPYPPVNIRTWMSGMAEAVHAGWIGAVGVSNYNRAQTQLAYDALAAEGHWLPTRWNITCSIEK